MDDVTPRMSPRGCIKALLLLLVIGLGCTISMRQTEIIEKACNITKRYRVYAFSIKCTVDEGSGDNRNIRIYCVLTTVLFCI